MTDCIEWTGCRCHGYGYRQHEGKVRRVHRIAWEQAHGPIPEGMVVMHLCNNRACFNIEHLRMGTQSENVKQAYRERRARSPRTKLSDDDVRAIRASSEPGSVLQSRYGVGKTTINDIRGGRRWSVVE